MQNLYTYVNNERPTNGTRIFVKLVIINTVPAGVPAKVRNCFFFRTIGSNIIQILLY